MIIALLDIITEFADYLKKKNLFITIHARENAFSAFLNILPKYNIHDHPYCLYIKSCSSAWQHCMERQEKIYQKLSNGPFYGMCYAGMEEFVFPISSQAKIIGFICVSGYGSDFKKALPRIQKTANTYTISSKKLQNLYKESTVPEKPPFTEIRAAVNPLCYMLGNLYEESFSKEQIAGEDLYTSALTYINRHYTDKISLAQVAEFCHCSYSAMSHCFKTKSGYGINAYINHLRIIKSKALLYSTKLSITEIAELVGFNDTNYFTNTFRKVAGVSPRSYRNQSEK